MFTVHATHAEKNLRLRFEKDTAEEALRTASHLAITGWSCVIDGPRRFVVKEIV